MKTSKEEMAKIYRKMADNFDCGELFYNDIEFFCNVNNKWLEKENVSFNNTTLYRIKPETITLKNGVTIPKPFDLNSLKDNNFYYVPSCCNQLIVIRKGFDIDKFGINIFYQEKEQAIEASKALFGIED